MSNKGNYSINGVAVEALGVVSPDALTDPTKWPVEEIEGYNYRHVMFADPRTGDPKYPAFLTASGNLEDADGAPQAAAGFAPTSNTYEGILDAVNAAVAAGGGIVQLPPTTITLTASLPVYSGVVYQGAGYVTTSTTIPDQQPTYVSGTRLLGDGTFPAFAGNSTDGVAAYGTRAAFMADFLGGVGIRDLCVQNFSHGCKIGSNFNPGSQYSEFANVIALQCGWGWWFENCIHNRYEKVYAFDNTLGQVRFRSSCTSAILQPGNSEIGELVVTVPPGNVTSRGVVVSSANGTIGGISAAKLLQANRFAPGTSTQAATMAAASANITVSDGTKFPVGMPVAFSASVNGFTVNRIYVVVSQVSNVIQVATSLFGTAVTASGNTAVNIATQGMPCVEYVPDDATAGNRAGIANVSVLNLEAGGTSKMLVQAPPNGFTINAPGIQNAGSTQDFCFMQNNNIPHIINATGSGPNIDVSDGNAIITLIGSGKGTNSLGAIREVAAGNWNGARLNIAQNLAGEAASFFNKQPGNCDFTYCGVPIAQRLNVSSSTSLSANAGQAGALSYTGSGTATWTLPTINSNSRGLPFWITNCATAAVTLTVNTDGSQLYSNVTGKTSYALTRGQFLMLQAADNGSGGYQWQVLATNGT